MIGGPLRGRTYIYWSKELSQPVRPHCLRLIGKRRPSDRWRNGQIIIHLPSPGRSPVGPAFSFERGLRSNSSFSSKSRCRSDDDSGSVARIVPEL
jgi:hypothetical protein